jgi:mannose-6-phosphate isomerase-like protein (cupin superfamily)
MMNSLVIAALATLACASELTAQSPAMAPAAVVTAQRLKQLGDSLTPSAATSAQLGQGPNFKSVLWHRETSTGLERHDAWSDILVVQAGSATILTGGVQEGATESSPGEWRGGTSRGATRQVIKAGDIVTTPAGTPHQMVLAPGEQITYVTFKVAAPH